MPAVPIVGLSGSTTVAAGVTTYLPVGAPVPYVTTEADAKQAWRTAGVFGRLRVVVSANSLSGACTVTLRKNGAASALTFSISAAATGAFSDVDTVTVGAGDEFCIEIAAAAGSGTILIHVHQVDFTATTGNVMRYVASRPTGRAYTAASGTHAQGLSDGLAATNPTESTRQTKFLTTCKARNLYVRVTANTCTEDTVVCLRINGASSGLTVTIPTTGTGVFELTGTDQDIAVNDLVNFAVITTAGGGSITITVIACDVLAGASGAVQWVGQAGGSLSPATTYFPSHFSTFGTNTTEANTQIASPGGWTLTNLAVNVTANTLGADSTLRTRVAGANGGNTRTVGAGVTGYLEGSGSETPAADELSGLQAVMGAGGTSAVFQGYSILATPAAAGPSAVLRNLL